MCVGASYGPGPRLSLFGRPRCAKRVMGCIDQLRDSVFFPISILMRNYLDLAVRRLKLVEFELLGLGLTLTMGHGVSLAIEKLLS